jgi:hypothetical protein
MYSLTYFLSPSIPTRTERGRPYEVVPKVLSCGREYNRGINKKRKRERLHIRKEGGKGERERSRKRQSHS